MEPFPPPPGYERRLPLDLTVSCRPWPATVGIQGYGVVMIDHTSKYAHRLAYQLHVGPIPRSWQVDHACHSLAVELGLCVGGPCAHRACWEPAHLEAVSNAENSRRGNHPLVVIARLKLCQAGHDLTDPSNVCIRSDGRPRCRLCKNAEQRKRRAKNGG